MMPAPVKDEEEPELAQGMKRPRDESDEDE